MVKFMNEFNEIAFDEYIMKLGQCRTLQGFDEIMFQASNDADISHHNFIRLCKISRFFMLERGIISGKE